MLRVLFKYWTDYKGEKLLLNLGLEFIDLHIIFFTIKMRNTKRKV